MGTFPFFLAVSDQVVVAIATIVLISGVLITAIVRYKADDFVKFWAAVGTVIGLALGSVGTFFFTKDQVARTESKLKSTELALQTSEFQRVEASSKIRQLSSALASAQPRAADELAQIQLQLLTRERPIPDLLPFDKRKLWDELLRQLIEQSTNASPSPEPRPRKSTPAPSSSVLPTPLSPTPPIEPDLLASPVPSPSSRPR